MKTKKTDPFILGTLAIVAYIANKLYNMVKHISPGHALGVVFGITMLVIILKSIHSLVTHKRVFIIEIFKYVKRFSFNNYELYLPGFIAMIAIMFLLSRFIELRPIFIVLAIIAVPIIALVSNYLIHAKTVKRKEHELRLYLKDDNLKVLHLDNAKILVSTRKLIQESDFKKLGYVLSTNIQSVHHGKYAHTQLIRHSINGSHDYTKQPIRTAERLTIILKDMGGQPQLKTSFQDGDNHIFKYVTRLNIKKLYRNMDTISHQFGGSLELRNKNGANIFTYRENRNKIYLLDDIVKTVSPKGKELAFIAGIVNGKTLVANMLKTKHCLVAGQTGSGKSVTMQGIIETLMRFSDNIYFYMMDFGLSAFNRYENFSNCNHIDTGSIDSVEAGIKELVQELEKRKKIFKTHGVEKLQEYNEMTKNILPYLILAIDEANSFKDVYGVKNNDPISNMVYQLMREGRKYGIFAIMAVQQTNDSLFFKAWKSQMSRLIHKLTDEIDVKNCSNNKTIQDLVPGLREGEYLLEIDGQFETVKACLSNRKHNMLYNELKLVYGANLSMEKPEKVPVSLKKETPKTKDKYIDLKQVDRLNVLYAHVAAVAKNGVYVKETYRNMAETLGTNKDKVNQDFKMLIERGFIELIEGKKYKTML